MKKTELVYGIHSCRRVLEDRHERIARVWFARHSKSNALLRLKKLAERQSLGFEEVSRPELDRISGQCARHQGVIIEKRPAAIGGGDLEAMLADGAGEPHFFLVLDQIQDPHNLGACLRTADAAGVSAVIIPRDNAAAVTPVVAKVASGAVETVPVFTVVNVVRTIRRLQKAGVWVVGTSGDACNTIYQQDLAGAIALVLGGEGRGMRKSVRAACDYLVSIPMVGSVESLNVAVAAGIALYEARRQRGA